MRERAPAFRSADHNADSACKPRQRDSADQAGEVAALDHSWAIEVSTADGHSWRNGVRLDTKGEAEAYILTHAAFEVNGYVTGRAIPCGDAPNWRMVSNRKGGRPVLTFPDGSCVLLDWRRDRGWSLSKLGWVFLTPATALVFAPAAMSDNERNALPGLWRQRTTTLDLDHGSLTYLASC